MQPRVLAYGELLWDLLPGGPVLGGAPANCAVRLASLGARTWMATRVGLDDFGRRAIGILNGTGLDLSLVQTDSVWPTGTVEVTMSTGGEPDYFIVPEVAYDHIEETAELVKLVTEVDAICFGTLVQRAEQSRQTLHSILRRAPNALRFFDINLRKNCYSPESITESLEAADILKVNQDELIYLGRLFGLTTGELPELAARLAGKWDIQACVTTLGSNGALAVAPGQAPVYEPGYRVKVADTCGAGDAFAAGFLREYLDGRDIRACCRRGNILGAVVSTQVGATEPITDELLARVRQGAAEINVEAEFAEFMREDNS